MARRSFKFYSVKIIVFGSPKNYHVHTQVEFDVVTIPFIRRSEKMKNEALFFRYYIHDTHSLVPNRKKKKDIYYFIIIVTVCIPPLKSSPCRFLNDALNTLFSSFYPSVDSTDHNFKSWNTSYGTTKKPR